MWIRSAAVLISAVSYGLIFPPYGWGALSWVCLVPLFLALRGCSGFAAAAFVWLWALVATDFIVVWLVPTLTVHFEWSLPASLAFWFGVGLLALGPYYALAFGLIARVARRLSPGARVALLAATWVAAEFARTHLGLESPWSKLGDSHASSPRLRQIADVGGVYAVSGVVALVNAALAEAIAQLAVRPRETAAKRLAAFAPLAASAAIVAATLVYGASRAEPVSAATLRVGVVQGNVPQPLRWSRAGATRVLRRYADLTGDLLRDANDAAPALIVWPENAIQTQLDDPSFGPPLLRLAQRVPLLIGAPRSETRDGTLRHFNSALLLRSDGAIESYDKRRLLVFSETRPLGEVASLGARGDLDAGSYTAGDRPGFFDIAGERIAVLICMEALYPALAREASLGGARVLVNLSNDGWYAGRGGAEQALAQVVFRAIETRLPVVRATTTGISALIAPDGAILAQIEEGVSGAKWMDVPVGVGDSSIHTRIGDAFALCCAAAWAFAVASQLRFAISRRAA